MSSGRRERAATCCPLSRRHISGDALLKLPPAPVADGAPDEPRVVPLLEQPLADVAFLRQAQEEPGDGDDRDDRPLEHHQGAREALVALGREPEELVAALV